MPTDTTIIDRLRAEDAFWTPEHGYDIEAMLAIMREAAAALAAPPAAGAPPDLVALVREIQHEHELMAGGTASARMLALWDKLLTYPLPAAPPVRACACGPSDECRDDGCQCACHRPAAPPVTDKE